MLIGFLKIRFTKNNVFINILNNEKKNLTLLTAGLAEFKHRTKNSFLAFQVVSTLILKQLVIHKISQLFIHFSGWSKFQRSFFMNLINGGIKIKGFKIDLKLPHGGVRLKKIRNK